MTGATSVASLTPVTHLLYLHGFRSSPQSTKARKFAAWVAANRPELVWWCPQLPWALEEADLSFCHSGGLTWDAVQALAPMGARAVVVPTIAELVNRVVAAARSGDHILCMSNGGFGDVHDKLLEALAPPGRAAA